MAVVSGIDLVLANFNMEIARMRHRTRGGMRRAVLLVRRAATPLTPLKTGNLRRSYYTEVFDTVTGPVGEIGLTASYAPYVHEIEGRSHTTPGTGPKFLLRALIQSQQAVREAIADEARSR